MTSVETRQQRRYSARRAAKGRIARPPQKNAFYRALEALKARGEALQAAAVIGPLMQKLALMDLAMKLGGYRSRGHGLCKPSYAHGRGSRGGNNARTGRPHQGAQERLRQLLGGWAMSQRWGGLTKRQFLEKLRTSEGRKNLKALAERVQRMAAA